jgi:hypothetical protein
MSGINYLINRINTYPLTKQNHYTEIQIVNHFLKANEYNQLKTEELIQKKERHTQNEINKQKHEKWAKFTYIGKETKYVTKYFREYNINIAFSTKNTIEKLINRKVKTPNKFEQCGVYKLNCNSCHKAYIGQTGRNFKTRFKEHIQDIKNNRAKTGFSQHILNTGHEYNTIDNCMSIIKIQNKGKLLNTLEKFYIYKEQKTDNLLNENRMEPYNPIYELLL